MNTFGQDPANLKIKDQLSKDLVQVKTNLQDCETLYQKNIDSKSFNTPLMYPITPSPMVADSTNKTPDYLVSIKSLETELQEVKTKHSFCDTQLRAEAKANQVELPNINNLLPFHSISNSNDNWECWSGPYHPAILTLSKAGNLKPFAALTSEYFQLSAIDEMGNGEYVSPNYSTSGQEQSWLGLGGLINISYGQTKYKLNIKKEGDKSLKLDVEVTQAQGATPFIYSCKPLQIQKAKDNSTNIYSGKAKIGASQSKDADGDASGTKED